ncbi:MAG: hypothetical protein GVY26_00635 [Bacteroidetes bacterium]|nr:hypothetical protein [Bacteroidota bacterium]
MAERTKGEILHDKATKGEELSPEENDFLMTWYAEQDQTEFDVLQSDEQVSPQGISNEIEQLTQRIQDLSDKLNEVQVLNNTLAEENRQLKAKLSKNAA